MKAIELDKVYNPKNFEDRIYSQWVEDGDFRPSDAKGEPFTVVMPPPNVTGILHMGHALNNSLQDILTRYYRMGGRPTLWVPGTDHAGIATQNVVERQIAKEGLRRQDLGREKFLERTWQVKEKHHDIIVRQLKKIGSSCDWEHERFTMDEGLSKAVRETFVSLYERGLIYRGMYLVNYCPHCGTALADDEVEHQNDKGHLWNINYPLADGSGFITVATTRPETMFGDVAVAVNPDDERYRHLVGKMLKLPLTDREIPVIADSFVGIEFGTGMVKITPAHDPNDWECGKRHNLTPINILNPDGTLNDVCPEQFRGIPAEKARFMVADELLKQGYLGTVQDYDHEVGHCYRCNTTVEPYMSEQWFVKMRPLADKALKAWKDGRLEFHPKRWENTYSSWLENIRDWCISRQLWWGHRIPVWYCKDCGNMMVKREDPCCCEKCGSKNIEQDNDVLDTWFSSWLWPFSTLGWPEQTADFKRFFPTSTLVTAYDIIFFWVSRMIMASLEFTGEVPFKDIYITGLVRDKLGRKMSKSLGNGIDPLEVVDLYGADAMKFTLCYLAAQGQDVLIDMDSFKMGSKFANKIWNATRYILMNLEGRNIVEVKKEDLNDIDRWIYHSFNENAGKVNEALKGYRFNEGAQAVYDFFWNDFCDWYIEASKPELYSDDDARKDRIVSILLDLLARSMRLMHPFLSFITEEIYDRLPNTEGKVISAEFPVFDESLVSEKEAQFVESLQEAVRGIRNAKASLNIPPDKKLKVVIRTDEKGELSEFMKKYSSLISTFSNSGSIIIDDEKKEDITGAFPVAAPGFESFLFVREAIDVDKEIAKLKADIEKTKGLLAGVEKKLGNPNFVNNAKAEAIEKEKSKKAEFEEKLDKALKHIEALKLL
ncbi:MAG: valine--tRNA ligase [Sphaerochaetaceae bacterium]|nr:valine--tRNA ligase [Sphaerochaetaceae bacterium]